VAGLLVCLIHDSWVSPDLLLRGIGRVDQRLNTSISTMPT